MPTFQIIEQVPAVRLRSLVVVCDSEFQVVDLYNKGSYVEETEWYEDDDSDVELTITELKAN